MDARSDGVVAIRPYAPGDADALFEAAVESVERVYPWLPWCHPGYTREESVDWIERVMQLRRARAAFEFAVTDAADGRFLGGVGVNEINDVHRFANLGYWVRTGAAGHGVATRAARLAAAFALEELELHRVEILAAVDNRASQRVAERVGARREGVLRRRLLLHGRPTDVVLFSIVAGDIV